MSVFQHFRFSVFVAIALLGYLWFRLFDHLRIEWSLNEQYAYGWAVPVLCAYLLYRRGRTQQNAEKLKTETSPGSGSAGDSPAGFGDSPKSSSTTSSSQRLSISPNQRFSVSAFLFLLLLAFLLTRLVEIANPDWRLVSWALALEVISISLAFIYLLIGAANARHFAFPILFFLMAVPWPTLIEHPTVQFLTGAIVAATVEVLNLFGVLAVPHGNVIETANGLVDVDEACSGIRSLQAALMLALFFGEWHRFTARGRIVLCVAGLGLACLFNLARTVVLSLVAAQQGTAAIQQWHDPAGIAILVGCFTGVWAFAAWLAKKQKAEIAKTENLKSDLSVSASSSALPTSNLSGQQPLSDRRPLTSDLSGPQPSTLNSQPAGLSAFQLFSFSAFLLLGEIAVWAWYRSAAPTSVADWNVSLPQQKPAFRVTELPANTVRILRFTEGKSARWENADGTQWQFFYFRWAPGRTAVNLARNHTPEICLPAAGHKLSIINKDQTIMFGDVPVSFRAFEVGQRDRPMFVFYSLWEDGAITQHSEGQNLTVESRLNAVRTRRRNPSQRVIEIAITGARDLAQAETSLRTELPKIIQIQPH